MIKIILILGAVIAAFYIAWVGGQSAYGKVIENQAISPGDVVISQVSNAKKDWVTLHNNLDHEVDLQGFEFTDGDNIFTLPQGSVLPAGGDFRIASTKDEGDIQVPVDQYWGDWGLSEDGEMVMLVNEAGDLVMDFVFAQSLTEGELLERIPAGTGPFMDPSKTKPMQIHRPSYRAVPTSPLRVLERTFPLPSYPLAVFSQA